MSKKKRTKVNINEAKKKREIEKERVVQSQIPLEQRLAESGKLGVIIAQNNPDNCIYTTPILKRIFYMHGVEINLYMAAPWNDSYLSFLGELPYVNSINILSEPQLSDEIIREIEDENGVAFILNYMIAYQRFLQTGVNVTQGMAQLIGMELGEDSLSLEIGVLAEYMELAEEIMTEKEIPEDFIVIAPHIAPNLPPNLKAPRAYPIDNWLELLSMLDDENYHCVIVGDDSLEKELLPLGISKNIIPAYTNNYRAIAGLMMKSNGVIAGNNWYCTLARALKKKIVQAHSGGPLTWDAAIYPKDSSNHGHTRVIASISIRSIWPQDILEAANDLFREKMNDSSK